jgi:hypothetical protein
MFPTNPTSRGRFSTVKKTHKAILGALFVSEKPLLPYNYGKKLVWTFDFLAPSGPVWDTNHPLIVSDEKIREMINCGYLTIAHGDGAVLTNGGMSIAEGSQHDWADYWDMFYARRMGQRFDWIQYFKTGIINLDRS